jgi:hypothetical protein
MIEDDTPLTELQLSQATGVRCFLVSPDHFAALATQIEEPRNLDGVHTIASFRAASGYPVSPTGQIMVSCRGNQISKDADEYGDDDDARIEQAIAGGILREVTVAEFAALKPAEDQP